jgi:hypothetical protein
MIKKKLYMVNLVYNLQLFEGGQYLGEVIFFYNVVMSHGFTSF